MLSVAILGASGYTGMELLRILAVHPEVEVSAVFSRQHKGASVVEVFPALAGYCDKLTMSDPEAFAKVEADAVFCCLPHGASQEVVPTLLKQGRMVIDLSADFRFKDAAVYNAWYGAHKAPGLLKDAVYGLPELFRPMIKGARFVANPGCYPTGAALALAPLAKRRVINMMSGHGSVIIDSKSGVSGAGRGAVVDYLFSEVSGGFKAYNIGSHRHTPEIEQTLSEVAGIAMSVIFTPHLLPVSRGILTTAYAGIMGAWATGDIHKLYAGFYADEPFVRVLPPGKFPDISHVRGSNYCDIGVYCDENKKRAVIVSVIDNLVKGASGQAVQNMNIMAGFAEDAGLRTPPMAV
ncbi:MAG: N-acetyl-gamma-glutamyl-phosphate reductase [Deltaproteobacteria bacterium]|nr:N-acetyl-gamma-glutamyl-phosphate reductase [Deltaproteobacteria bacterium]